MSIKQNKKLKPYRKRKLLKLGLQNLRIDIKLV
jgi:hypothetical protein